MTSKNEIKIHKKLGISSWGELSPEKFNDFAKLIPKMNEETIAHAIKALPHSIEFYRECIDVIQKSHQTVLENNNFVTERVLSILDDIQKTLSRQLDRDNISDEENRYIIDKIMEVAKMIDGIDDRNKKFLDTTFGKVITTAGAGVLVATAFILGALLNQGTNEKDSDNEDLEDLEEDDIIDIIDIVDVD